MELGTSELEIALAGELALEAGLEPIVRVAEPPPVGERGLVLAAGQQAEISPLAIALVLAQERAARVAEPARCR